MARCKVVNPQWVPREQNIIAHTMTEIGRYIVSELGDYNHMSIKDVIAYAFSKKRRDLNDLLVKFTQEVFKAEKVCVSYFLYVLLYFIYVFSYLLVCSQGFVEIEREEVQEVKKLINNKICLIEEAELFIELSLSLRRSVKASEVLFFY